MAEHRPGPVGVPAPSGPGTHTLSRARDSVVNNLVRALLPQVVSKSRTRSESFDACLKVSEIRILLEGMVVS
ncbi:hypothetical protein GCM10023074_12530 [Microbispora amethystogenes]|uniref:Uncharacterized protein n=1 Tax=Microbispora amethystogenes TaxID=1427754 RepID=A0ABQ4FMY4_9ACTN|nr:hypothetical protein Mam01_63210 [Microbispora amethystogenes]